ncbi:MAG: ornithine cyclodeaminase family protein [Anaerolineae bacterium]|nr:ornithine cyclodeaminase family protein [Anaerolineae bacterium]
MPLLLNDDDLHRHVSPAEAVAVMESVFRARAEGQTAGTARWEMPFPEGRMVFTPGAVPDGVGFRVYLRGSFSHDDQVVVVWDRDGGALKGFVVGGAVGALRTGAIGGVAIKHMTPPSATVLALVGAGRQAWTQLQAILAVRTLDAVRVYARSPERRAAFCDKARATWPDLNIAPVGSIEEAVHNAPLIVTATTTRETILHAEWLMPGAHVSTLGTKGRNFREVDDDLVASAAWIVTDSPEQTHNYAEGSILDGAGKTLLELADVVAGKIARPAGDGPSLFISSGLAGTEVALAARLFDNVTQ